MLTAPWEQQAGIVLLLQTRRMKADPLHVEAEEPDPVRELRIVFAGSHRFGVFVDEIETISDWRAPTPLPQAPKSVLGIVCIHGRMLTVINVAALLGADDDTAASRLVALRGDEQLAFAIHSVGEAFEVAAADVLPASDDQGPLVLGVVQRGGESIAVLNVRELFPAAIRGRERRRRRF